MNRSIDFFESQFARQIRERDFALNPFETLALEHLRGDVLELGCGLGNLALEAARRGHRVVAVDASPTAIARIHADAAREALPVEAMAADAGAFVFPRTFDTVVSIGLLMFLPRDAALERLRVLQEHVSPGGLAIVNVLVEGTTFLDMFEPGHFHLFGKRELEEHFAGWRIHALLHETFPAPGETRKEFCTIVAEREIAGGRS